VVSFITKEPEFELGGDAEVTFGEFGQFVAKATVTGPIVEDVLAFRVWMRPRTPIPAIWTMCRLWRSARSSTTATASPTAVS
jgi:hypothetical protein